MFLELAAKEITDRGRNNNALTALGSQRANKLAVRVTKHAGDKALTATTNQKRAIAYLAGWSPNPFRDRINDPFHHGGEAARGLASLTHF